MLTLITGLPGSGKSSVARILSKELGASVFNSDVIRRELFPHSRSYTSKETQAVIAETRNRVERALKEGKIVILDALFTKQQPRDEYQAIARSFNIPFHLIYVTTPEEIVKERLEKRQETGDPSEADFDFYLNRKPHFEKIEREHFVIENAGSLEELEMKVREITKKLKA